MSRSIANTRPRDFYDVFILHSLRWSGCNVSLLRAALERTASKRRSLSLLSNYRDIVTNIRNNPRMQEFWVNYQKDFDYAKDISFEDTCDTVFNVMQALEFR